MTEAEVTKQPLYIFLDEGGNLDFSPTGSRYFSMTGVWMTRPFPCDAQLHSLRFDLIESGLDIERFHATEDKQTTRNRVFDLIRSCLHEFKADSVIVEKRKTGPSLQEDDKFYPKMLGYLLRYIVKGCDLSKWSEVIVITDQIPINKKRKAVEKAIKTTLSDMLPPGTPYRVLHHASMSCAGLQIADYFNWAIYRKWERGDDRSHALISTAIRSEFDIFRTGKILWY